MSSSSFSISSSSLLSPNSAGGTNYHSTTNQNPFNSANDAPALKTVETQSRLLGLATPASRPYSLLNNKQNDPISTANIAINTSTPTSTNPVTPLREGEIVRGLCLNDPLLPSRRHLISQILNAVDNAADLQVSSAALRIISALSDAPQLESSALLHSCTPHRLVSILQEGGETEVRACMARFRRRLEREESEGIQFLADGREFPSLLSVGAVLRGTLDFPADALDAFGLTNLIRLQIVDLLARNVGKASFNLSHLVLGIASGDKSAAFDRSACLPLLIDMLTFGLGHESQEAPVLLIEHPALGIRLLALLRQLSPFTGVWEYLREERELFLNFARHLSPHLPRELNELSLTYQLLQRSQLFSLLATDLHQASTVDARYTERLVEALKAKMTDWLVEVDGISATVTLSNEEGDFEAAVAEELAAAINEYVISWSTLCGQVVLAANGSDKCASLSSALITRFLSKASLSPEAIESLLQLQLLNGTEKDAQVSMTLLLRPDLPASTRCLLYASLMRSDHLKASDDSMLRVMQIAAKDALTGGNGDPYVDALVTVALGCLESLLPERILSDSSFVSGLMASLRVDDAFLVQESSYQAGGDMSVALKWRAKWSLLMAMLTVKEEESIDCNQLLCSLNIFSVPFCLQMTGTPEGASVMACLVLPVLRVWTAMMGRPIRVTERVQESLVLLMGKIQSLEGDAMIVGLLKVVDEKGIDSISLGVNSQSQTISTVQQKIKHVVLEQSCKASVEVLRQVRLQVPVDLTFLIACLDCIIDREWYSAISPAFHQDSKLSMGHLVQLLKIDCLEMRERVGWLCLGVLEERLKSSNTNNALKADAQLMLVPVLSKGETSTFYARIVEQIKKLLLQK